MSIWNSYFECMDREDLRDNYPYGLFAVPISEIVRLHASSGTTGKPTVVGYTHRDIVTWTKVMARTLTSAGADRNDFIHIAFECGIKPHYQLVVDRINNLDSLELQVEVDEIFFQDKISQLQALKLNIQNNIESFLGIRIQVHLIEPKTLARSEGKSQRVIDKRKL